MSVTLRDCVTKAKPALMAAVETLFPARCAACREAVGAHGALCARCWGEIHFITDPLCHRCGLPFPHAMGGGIALCGRCMAEPPAFTEARAVFRYDGSSRAQILALKYHDKTQLAPVFAAWLARAGKDYAAKTQLILPVPLHYWRLLGRRYNQAALLAHALSKHTGLPVATDALTRIRVTSSQAGLTRRGREDNVRGAFAVPSAKRALLKGMSVLLVDDVMTTGATLAACARALHDAGVRDVYVLTLARTVVAD
jgi:ComF family protein